MKAILWIHESKCRILLYSTEGNNIIESNDDWNNRASAEMTVLSYCPEAEMTFVPHTDTERIRQLNEEWKKYTEEEKKKGT